MQKKTELIIEDFLEKTLYKDRENPFIEPDHFSRSIQRYTSLYEELAPKFCELFSYMHFRLIALFEFWNSKYNPGFGGHFNADPSRELITLIEGYKDIFSGLKNTPDEIEITSRYAEIIDLIYPLLSNSGGSSIPPEFGKIEIIKHDPIFRLTNTSTNIINTNRSYKLTVVGEGSYAIVRKYYDEHYNRWFAIKQANKSLTTKELARFKKEFDILASLKFPYILEVFSFDGKENSYTMEFCSHNLKDYILKNNQRLTFLERKKIALQFLYGVNFLYIKGYLHRDLSANNILIKEYDANAVFVKICDFGLVKEENSDLTDPDTSGKGSTYHKDPLLESFKDIKIENEVYSIGCILNFIFTGRQNLSRNTDILELNNIIDKCTDNKSLDHRYHNVLDIIRGVEALDLKQNTP